jgi:hypothetical protein
VNPRPREALEEEQEEQRRDRPVRGAGGQAGKSVLAGEEDLARPFVEADRQQGDGDRRRGQDQNGLRRATKLVSSPSHHREGERRRT